MIKWSSVCASLNVFLACSVSLHGVSHEILRRRSLRLLKEMRFTLEASLMKSNRLENLIEMANFLEINIEALGQVEGAGEAQRVALQKLSETFTESIRVNQVGVSLQLTFCFISSDYFILLVWNIPFPQQLLASAYFQMTWLIWAACYFRRRICGLLIFMGTVNQLIEDWIELFLFSTIYVGTLNNGK